MKFTVRPKERNSLLAHGDGQILKTILMNERLSCCQNGVSLVCRNAGSKGELAKVGTYSRSSPVLAEIGSLRISQDWNLGDPSGINDSGAKLIGERTLGVVG